MSIKAQIPDFDALYDQVLQVCTNPDSDAHGPHHWRHVARVGHILMERGAEGDPTLVLLFALFHDCNRVNDFEDPQHGLRGGTLAILCGRGGFFNISDDDMQRLFNACLDHTHGDHARNPTEAICWDADRLNLMRVMVYPDPQYLSTEEAKDEELIAQCSEQVWDKPPTWAELIESFESLTR